jgi:all-trans-8'-apo-beta-carotenal 15,15'-oxygenase
MPYKHWLDGDGLVCALHFDDSGVGFVSRFVSSTKRQAEKEAGEALFRTFGTAFDGDRLRKGISLESPVNVSAYRFGDTLLAFGEQGLPWALDPRTLETRGEHTFDGRLNAISPLSAHPRFDRGTGEMFNFGISFSVRHPCLHVYRFDADGKLLYRRRVPLEHPCSVHDFGISPSYIIFHISPYILDVEGLMAEGQTLMDSLHWQPEEAASRLIILSREDGSQLASLPIGNRYSLHQINAFETGSTLHVDVVELDRPVYDQYQILPDLFVDAPFGSPVRLSIETKDWSFSARHRLSYRSAPDFPSVDRRQALGSYEDFWLLGISTAGRRGRKFFDQLVHLSWSESRQDDIYQAPPHCYLGGEPAFVPDPSRKEGGAIICQSFDAEREKSYFLIFDAYDVAAGPLARLPLESPIPPLFHSFFQVE